MSRKKKNDEEKYHVFILPCVGFRSNPPRPCNTLIGIALDMGPAMFLCPVCNGTYVVDPLTEGTMESEEAGFGAMEIEGHRVELFEGEGAVVQRIISDYQAKQAFYVAKVGSSENVYMAHAFS